MKFISMLNEFTMNIPLLKNLKEMSGYVKFIKVLLTKKRIFSYKDIGSSYH